jgi:integrase
VPARQRGSVVKRGKSWQARWYDEDGQRHARGGFETKTAAGEWLDSKVKEVLALRRGDLPTPDRIPTVNDLVQGYLDTHEVDPATTYKLRSQLRHATRAFDGRKIDELTPLDLSTWRATLPARTRHQPFGAFKAVLEDAVTLGLLQTNPAGRIKNRQTRLDESREILPFTHWDQVEMVAEELTPLYAPIPIILVGSGLRPEEAWGLEWRDVDLREGVLNVERVYMKGVLKPCKKSDRQRRQVPLRARVIEALERIPRGFGQTPVLLSRTGGRVELETFRHRHWNPALAALKDAGIEHRGVYACRHTFATWSIRAGVDLFHLSRVMGTSLRMIDRTYGHLAPDAHAYIRGKLDSYDAPAMLAEGLGTE